jgi:PBP1b-binding outer membrane lipoprotein LpoB
MKTLIFKLLAGTLLVTGCNKEEAPRVAYEPFRRIPVVETQDAFHDDFDSTYQVHGCQYLTFKFKHECNVR